MQLSNVSYSIHSNHLEVIVIINPYQALYGFEMEIPYINHKHLRINRIGKITFPGSNSTVTGLGLPVWYPNDKKTSGEEDIPSSSNNNPNEEDVGENNEDNSIPVSNGTWVHQDLIVKFELSKELDDPDNKIDSKEIIDEYIRIMSICGNYTSQESYNKVLTPDVGNRLVIAATDKNIVITGKSFHSSTNTPSRSSIPEDTFNNSNTNYNFTMENNQTNIINNCTEIDHVKYVTYMEEQNLRKLLELLRKQREDEEYL